MQWLIDLVIEAIGIPPTFIDRGDPGARDFAQPFWTEDAGWHDLDLSAIIPAGATAVLFTLYTTNVFVLSTAEFRKKGNVNARNVSRAAIVVAAISHANDFVCPLDSNRKIQYKVTAVGWAQIDFTVKGWWL